MLPSPFHMYHPTHVSEERLTIVDENDAVIGTEKRGIIHRDRLLHRAVHILVFNSKGQLYLQRRSMNKDAAPGKWDSSASGHVDAGEGYLVAAERELSEELNLLENPALTALAKLPASRQTGMEFTMIYRCLSDETPDPNPHEIMEGRWVAPEELDTWMHADPKAFAGCFRLVWKTFRNPSPAGNPKAT